MSTLDLNCLLWNAENLFLLSDRELTSESLKLDPIRWKNLSTSVFENKPLTKLHQISQIITKHSPEIVMFCEVGGLESLNNFNRLFLNNQYSPALIEGNSDRHIDVGYLIKKNMNFFFDIISNKNRLINFNYPQSKALTSEKFSRDVAELHLFNKDREKPFFIFLVTHLKSRLDPNFIDPNGYLRRSAELKALVEIYKSLESRHQNQVPIAVCGDFNGLASRPEYDSEFVELYQQTQLEDVLHLAQVPMDRRTTYFQTSRASSPDGKQIDYAFLSPKAQNYLIRDSAFVLRFQDELGQELDPPSNLEAKEKMPSDHYPVLFKLKGIPAS